MYDSESYSNCCTSCFFSIQRCPTYTNLPQMCRLESHTGSCCKEIVCDHPLPIGPTHVIPINTKPPTQCPGLHPYCYDRLDNCRAYGKQACGNPYMPWARRNCPFTCGFCTCCKWELMFDRLSLITVWYVKCKND